MQIWFSVGENINALYYTSLVCHIVINADVTKLKS